MLRTYSVVFSVLLAVLVAGSGHVAGQQAGERVAAILAEVESAREELANFSASIILEDRNLSLKGETEFLKKSQIFTGEFANKATKSIPASPWQSIEFGLSGEDAQIYYPDRRLCEIHKDNRIQLLGPYPENPALLFTTRPLELLKVLVMPGEAKYLPESTPEDIRILVRFPGLIGKESAALHETELRCNERSQLVEFSYRGGVLGNSTWTLDWKQAEGGTWYPAEQTLLWPNTYDVPDIVCKLENLKTSLSNFQFLPATVVGRLPFATRIEEFGSKFAKQGNRSIEVSYAGGDAGETQYKLDTVVDELKARLKVGDN